MASRDTRIKSRLAALGATRMPLNVIDLFAGCGGFSLGFAAAGFRILAGLESESVRAQTFYSNLRPSLVGIADPSTDITVTRPAQFLARFRVEGEYVDGILGGPPCQAYARVGRAKLREVAGSVNAYAEDARGRLYERYLDYIEELAPLFVVMENVPDMLSVSGRNLACQVATQLEEMGYRTRYTLLNAAGYGVPQLRERLFLIGIHRTVGVIPSFPAPTFNATIPAGFTGTRSAALRALRETLSPDPHLVPLPDYSRPAHAAVTAAEALSDLPRVGTALRAAGRGPRDLSLVLPYHSSFQNAYQREMRRWCGLATRAKVSANASRYLPRDFPIFARMAEGDDYPKALAVAERLFEEEVARRSSTLGRSLDPGELRLLRKEIVPGYDGTKFPNKWRKLERNAPARTLMAHLSHDSYTHIHYDSDEARTITVREAARLQSFPDGFQFEGAMNAAFAQIGNAVPPLLAQAIGGHLLRELRHAFGERFARTEAESGQVAHLR